MERIQVILLVIFCNIYYPKTFAQENFDQSHFIINGKVNGRDTGTISLMYINSLGERINDITLLKNGNFHFTGTVIEPTKATLSGIVKTKLVDDPNTILIFIEPGQMRIDLKESDFIHAKITGSKTQDELTAIRRLQEPFRVAFDSVKRARSLISISIEQNGKSFDSETKLKELTNQLHHNASKIHEIEHEFFVSHPNSFLSPYFMFNALIANLPLDSAINFYRRFSVPVKNSSLGKDLFNRIKVRAEVTVGNKAANFIAKDIKEKMLNLNDFKQKKYVLLDFWASWCVPCKEQVLYLKKLYSTYHDKGLEIISISYDKNRTLWKEAVEKENMEEWYNIVIMDTQLTNDELPMDLKFPIDTYPTLILIDKNGVIRYHKKGFDKNNGLRDLEEILMAYTKETKN